MNQSLNSKSYGWYYEQWNGWQGIMEFISRWEGVKKLNTLSLALLGSLWRLFSHAFSKNAQLEYVSNLWCIFRKISVNLNKFQFLTYVTNFFWGKIFSCESCEYLARWITTSIFLLSGDTQSSGKPSVDFKISPKSPTWSPHASSTEESPMSQVDQFREDQSESITNLQNHDLMNTFFKLLF